ncbi:MAG: LysM peptidoglycan-binding domain-containing protein, partial [Anaerolineales bacterium]|nr:LysM peptidoglycan-binding domain-containing protein [Anaerolineales bacterium]
MARGEGIPAEMTGGRGGILLLVGVVLALVMSLSLARMDERQARLIVPPSPPAVANLPSPTPRPTLALPTATSTPRPMPLATPGTTLMPASTPTSTAVPIMPACGLIPTGWQAYHIVSGDSLFTLSVRSGATISEIQHANCLENSQIFAGAVLYLPPVPPARPPCGPPLSWVTYVVQ